MRNPFSNARGALALAIITASLAPHARADGNHGEIELSVVGITDDAGAPLGTPQEGERAVLSLALVDRATSRPLTPDDLEIVHEKRFHAFSFDAGLTNYVHEHPDFDAASGTWKVAVTYRRAGTYELWADVTRHAVTAGENEYARTRLTVEGASTPSERPRALPSRLSGVDGRSRLTLEPHGTIRANRMAMYGLKFTRTDGAAPRITPYLGAMAHVVITNLAGDRLIHAHAMEMRGELMVHTEFPAAGDYRAFVQFVDKKELRTVELNLRVAP